LSQFKAAFGSAAASASVVVLTGSLPAHAPIDFFRQLLEYIPGRAVLDCRGPELLACLDARPTLVKPNRQELSGTLGRPLDDDHDLKDAMRELQDRGAQTVVVSDGGGPTWVAADGDFYQVDSPPVTSIVNAIGCGDCLAAGIAWSLSRGGTAREAVRTGLAAAAKNLQTLLPSDFDGRRQRHCRR
jgi:fructose-1-phosphate kinase PfkB-like protein